MTGKLTAALLLSTLLASPVTGQDENRVRSRDAGIITGTLEPGELNMITDVAGVKAGHVTLVEGDNIRTGVTAIIPHSGNLFADKVPAAIHCFNGFGKLAGYLQVRELGNIETPIVLTNTLNVGTAVDAVVRYMLNLEGNENVRSVNAVVGETNDGFLNDIRGQHVKAAHIEEAVKGARGGPVEEGSVGAGTGTTSMGFKAGIGTASRKTPSIGGKSYTVGVLVQSNFGRELVINGVTVPRDAVSAGTAATAGGPEAGTGRSLPGNKHFADGAVDPVVTTGNAPATDTAATTGDPATTAGDPAITADKEDDGSCMIIIATDAPISSRNLERLARRSFNGMARTTRFMSNSSGDFAIAFSTAYRISHGGPDLSADMPPLLDNSAMDGLFRAVEEATQEAVYNSLFMAEGMEGRDGNRAGAVSVARVLELLEGHNMIKTE